MTLTPDQTVAVIGAGPMGLACAYAIAKAGCRVTIFEADDRIGGMSAFFDRLPPMTRSVRGFYMADTAYYYPEDRSVSESIQVGMALADTAINHAA